MIPVSDDACSGLYGSPGVQTTIETLGVSITTIVYLRILIIQVGSHGHSFHGARNLREPLPACWCLSHRQAVLLRADQAQWLRLAIASGVGEPAWYTRGIIPNDDLK